MRSNPEDFHRINCHTHVFIGDNVPPYLAKTFMPWPLFQIFNTRLLLRICRWWFLSKSSPANWQYKKWYQMLEKVFHSYRSLFANFFVLNIARSLFNFLISYHAIIYVIDALNRFIFNSENGIQRGITWIVENGLLYVPENESFRLWVVLFVFIFIASGRKIIWGLIKRIGALYISIPDKSTFTFLRRYFNIGRYAYYRHACDIYYKLRSQYAPSTGFVILPMDMEFMDAGKLKPEGDLAAQMSNLYDIKTKHPEAFPFIAVDPRRESAGGKPFLHWKSEGNKVILEDCFIREYLEEKEFSGIKIYPALGYYPFDEKLLPLWKYAADNGIPIMTHCIAGTIYYRGKKEKEWNAHPIFETEPEKPLELSEINNIDFSLNFTHPLNYLCLLEERLLRRVVASAGDRVKVLFGYTNPETPLRRDLSELKICMAHYGGDDQWQKFLDRDRDQFSNKVISDPEMGIDFVKHNESIDLSLSRISSLWPWLDWYSIISSMMIQYENVYADISYIDQNPAIYPLLKSTIAHPQLGKKVLFGTDFYVVRNHKSEKEITANVEAALSTEEFQKIAKTNAVRYLMTLHG
jgi:hypothetical protein